MHRSRSEPLSLHATVDQSTEKLHATAMIALHSWLARRGSSVKLEVLVGAPMLLDLVLCAFCNDQYLANEPLYMYLMVITALQRFKPSLRHNLPMAWNMATNWRLAEPVCHRTPLPLAVYRALVTLAVLRGPPRFAGCVVIAFSGPTRVTETIKAAQRCLMLPCDSLGTIFDRVYIHFTAPKSARRGGALHQHATVKGSLEVGFLTAVFKDLAVDAALYPLSAATFRKRWDALLALIGIPAKLYTPGSMRGGGAVAAYMADCPISDILWRMRLRSSQTLEHYLQEVTAASSLISLSGHARSNIAKLSGLYEAVLSHDPRLPFRQN